MIPSVFFYLFSAVLLASATAVVTSRNAVHSVLFLFVVMMLDVERVQTREGFQKYAPVGAAVGVVLFGELAAVLFGWQVSPGADALRQNPIPADMFNTHAIGQVLYTDYVLLIIDELGYVEFEKAAALRDELIELRKQIGGNESVLFQGKAPKIFQHALRELVGS